MPWPRLPGDSGGFGSLPCRGERRRQRDEGWSGVGEGALTCESAGVAEGNAGGVGFFFFPHCPTCKWPLVPCVAFVPWGVPEFGLLPAWVFCSSSGPLRPFELPRCQSGARLLHLQITTFLPWCWSSPRQRENKFASSSLQLRCYLHTLLGLKPPKDLLITESLCSF